MARRPRANTVGAEAARQRLPELLDRAHRGETTIITKRGRPYAALMPPETVRAKKTGVSLVSLHGSGKGLWGKVAGHIAAMRQEWR